MDQENHKTEQSYAACREGRRRNILKPHLQVLIGREALANVLEYIVTWKIYLSLLRWGSRLKLSSAGSGMGNRQPATAVVGRNVGYGGAGTTTSTL